MSICRQCGCEKPCQCDLFSNDGTCLRCGCDKPCECDGYTEAMDHTAAPLSHFDQRDDDDDGA
jgi:hypothetical protein